MSNVIKGDHGGLDEIERPEDVRIIYNDGEEVECNLEYVGQDCEEADIDMWEITNAPRAVDFRAGDKMSVGRLPARSGLRFACEDEQGKHNQ